MKSKNLFILFIIPAFFIYACGKIPAYRQLSSFNGDTLAYLKYNFENNRVSYYSGKSMDTLLNDLEIPVKCIIPTFNTEVNDGLCDGLLIYFDDKYNTELKLYNEIRQFSMKVYINPKVQLNDVDEYIKSNGGPNWNSALKAYFGKLIISELIAFVNPDPIKEAELCDPSSSRYSFFNCRDGAVNAFYEFTDTRDLSFNNNVVELHDGAETNGYLELTGGNPWDYLHPHATAANSPSLNPQFISVAARIKPEEFVGSGNDVIVSKPFTGNLVASKAKTGPIDTYATDLFIGKQGNTDYSIPAWIDWVKTYNRALSDTEVKALSEQ